jgi:NAD(P)H-flavin reductase
MIDEKSLHVVYVVDEKGKPKILAHLKQAIDPLHHTTLIYLYSKDDFIFDRELDLLQKRHPIQFLLNPVKEKMGDVATALQELLKAVINSNTKDKLIFILSADDEVVFNASHTLWLSGIEEKQIKIHFSR